MTLSFRCTAQGNALALSACLLLAVMTFAGPAAHAAQPPPTLRFDLPAQPLATALVAFGELTGYSVLVSSELVEGRSAAAVCGEFTPAEALQRLLVGTQLGVHFRGSAFTLQALPATAAADAGKPADPVATPSPLPAYAAVLQRSITRTLCRLHPEAFGRYRLAFQLWLDERGKVREVHILQSSGVAQRDRAILLRLRGLLMDDAPPAGLAQPLTILLTPRPNPAEACLPYLVGAG